MFERGEIKLIRMYLLEHGDIGVAMFQAAEYCKRIPIEFFNDVRLTRIIKAFPQYEADIYFAYQIAIMLKFSDIHTDSMVLDNIREILRAERGQSNKPRRIMLNLNLN